ncbi:MAG: DUF3883 domain-containing protein [Bacteroidaceae bacterium]|nr:DUF3883 domain-containing protein [Bacteroidaceae bacterium]
MQKILFANIGWMKRYRGHSNSDKIRGGGSYNPDDKHEAFNFQDVDGHCYGYVQPTKWCKIKIERIDPSCLRVDDYLDDVLVVWTATNPIEGGTFIVGWYRHARVYRTFQNGSKLKERNGYGYNIEALSSDCTLLIEQERTMRVPRATNALNKGFMGQSNIWYADNETEKVVNFRKLVVDYINNYVKPKSRMPKPDINVEAKIVVEKAAISAVTSYYKEQGYTIYSVESENKGWDLEAYKGKSMLRIEVKGLSGSDLSVHITKNEYSQMKSANNYNYRLCVVTNAVSSPRLWTFAYDNGIWICEQDYETELLFEEHIAAIAYIE